MGFDNVAYDDGPAVYYPKVETTDEPLKRDAYLEQTTYKSKIKYDNKKYTKAPKKSSRLKKDLKLQVPPVIYGRQYIPLKYRKKLNGKTTEKDFNDDRKDVYVKDFENFSNIT